MGQKSILEKTSMRGAVSNKNTEEQKPILLERPYGENRPVHAIHLSRGPDMILDMNLFPGRRDSGPGVPLQAQRLTLY